MSSPVKQWTPARYKSFITSALRGGFTRYPPKFEVLSKAYTCTKINEASGRKAKHYRCKKCGGEFVSKNIQVDHIKPIIDPTMGFTTWDDYISRLYCETKNLQCLCISCHAAKTKKERDVRTKHKNV